MSRIATVLLLGSLAIVTATRSYTQGARLRKGKQLGKMNPEAVAHTLSAVEGKWLTQAVAFAQCNASDAACQEDTMGEFKKSCQTVVGAVVQGSNGDKSVVSEYMGDICEQDNFLHSWKKGFCKNFASALNQVLTDDAYVNRDDLALDTVCANFLKRGFLKEAAKEEVARAEKEKEEAIVAQKRREEEETKREEEETAAATAEAAKENEAKAKAETAIAAKVRANLAKANLAKANFVVKADEATQNTTQVNVTVDQVNVTVTSVTAANSTVDASKNSSVASSTDASAAPANVTTESVVSANATTESVAANGTAATAAPKNNTK